MSETVAIVNENDAEVADFKVTKILLDTTEIVEDATEVEVVEDTEIVEDTTTEDATEIVEDATEIVEDATTEVVEDTTTTAPVSPPVMGTDFVLPPSAEKLSRDVLDSVLMDFAAARAAVAKTDAGKDVIALAEKIAAGAVTKNPKNGFLSNLTTRIAGSNHDYINPWLITMVSGWNSRYDSDENRAWIDQLARSIAKIGVRNPVTVHVADREIRLTDGHMRLFATLRAIYYYGAKVESVPFFVESKLSTDADRMARQLLTGKRRSFHKIV
jgi:hypothetical protein